MMTERKWTPGPWAVDGDEVYAPNIDWHICRLQERDGVNVEEDANLIAAAPDLYEALEDAERVLEWGEPDPKPALDRVRSALAKARGEE